MNRNIVFGFLLAILLPIVLVSSEAQQQVHMSPITINVGSRNFLFITRRNSCSSQDSYTSCRMDCESMLFSNGTCLTDTYYCACY